MAIRHELGIKKASKFPLKMIDNDFQNYNHAIHLALIKQHRPELATACDIEDFSQVSTILTQAEEIKSFCDKLILIPKINCLNEIKAFARGIEHSILLGYPVGRFEDRTRLKYCLDSGFKIHLLGGSFKKLKLLLDEYNEFIYSLDTNYPSRIAGYGKLCTIMGDRVPSQLEVPSGKDYNYRCFDLSLKLFDLSFQYKQTSLF